MNKTLFASVSFAVLALVIGAVTMFSPLNPRVSALEQINKSVTAINRLSDSSLTAIRAHLVGDPKTILNEAKNAKDLKEISRTDYDKLLKDAGMYVSQSKSTDGSIAVDVGGKVDGSSSGTVSVNSDGTVNDLTVSNEDKNRSDLTVNRAAQREQQKAAGIPEQALENQLDQASAFVKFTGKNGRVVVIAFDKTATPLFRTVFK